MTSNRTRIVTAVHQDQPMSHKLANDQNVAIARRPTAPVNPTPLLQSAPCSLSSLMLAPLGSSLSPRHSETTQPPSQRMSRTVEDRKPSATAGYPVTTTLLFSTESNVPMALGI